MYDSDLVVILDIGDGALCKLRSPSSHMVPEGRACKPENWASKVYVYAAPEDTIIKDDSTSKAVTSTVQGASFLPPSGVLSHDVDRNVEARWHDVLCESR